MQKRVIPHKPNGILVGSSVEVGFVIQALQACLDRWWKGVPSGQLPGLLLILLVCLVHHNSMHEGDILVEGIYSEKSNLRPQNHSSLQGIKNNTEKCADLFRWYPSLLISG